MKRDEEPKQGEVAKIVAFLRAHGIQSNIAADIVRGTRGEIARRLREYLHQLSPAVDRPRKTERQLVPLDHSSGPIIAQDTFTDTTGVLILNHTTDSGHSWVSAGWSSSGDVLTNPGEIDGNRLKLTGNSAGVAIESGESDVYVHVNWTPFASSNDRHAVLGRYASPANTWMHDVRQPNSDVRLIEVVAGSVTIRASSAYSFATGTTYNLEMLLEGTSITSFINGVQIHNYTSVVHATATMHGLTRKSTTLSSPVFDDFHIRSLETAASVVGSVTQTLEGVAVSSAGRIPATASLTRVLQGVSAESSATAPVNAQVALTLEGVTVSSSGGGVGQGGSVTALLEGVTATASASSDIVGSLAGVLEGIQVVSHGSLVGVGNLTRTLEGASVFSEAASVAKGSTITTLEGVTVFASGTPIAEGANLAAVLEGVASVAEASVIVTARIQQNLEGVSLVATSAPARTGAVTVTLQGVTVSSTASDGETPPGHAFINVGPDELLILRLQ